MAGSLTATKVHGCRWAPLGAVEAVRMAVSMRSRGTGSSLKKRTLRRASSSASSAAPRWRLSAIDKRGGR